MTFSRYESVSLPQTENGRYMARMYADDMKNAKMTVVTEETTLSIKVIGRFMGEIPDEYVSKLKEMDGRK